MTHVPFSGAGPAIQALLSGTTQVACAALPPAHPFIESGALKALAVTSAHRWFDLPDVPTMVELGFEEVIANGPEGMRRRIEDEVPKWRDVVTKAGIKPV